MSTSQTERKIMR